MADLIMCSLPKTRVQSLALIGKQGTVANTAILVFRAWEGRDRYLLSGKSSPIGES